MVTIVTDLGTPQTNPEVLKGKAVVAHDVETGDPILFNASKLCRSDYKDLSMFDIFGASLGGRTTANCYVIRTAGAYMIPLVYGNAIKNGLPNEEAYTNQGGANQRNFVNHLDVPISSPYIEQNANCAVTGAMIIWSDEPDMIKDLELVEGGDCKYLRFNVDSIPALNGNALISVTNSSGVVWSWHIWCCKDDLTPTPFYNNTNVVYELMKYNLGWKWDSAAKTSGRSPHFQWGRPHPMPVPASGASNSNATLHNVGKAFTTMAADTIGAAIKNPNAFFLQDGETYYNWFTGGSKYNLWNAAINSAGASDNQDTAIKTVYDPCPVGFMIPAGRAFTGFTTTGAYTTDVTQFNKVGDFARGWNFKRKSDDAVGVFFPASGYRNRASGGLGNVGGSGFYWSFASGSQADAYSLGFSSGGVSPLDGNYRAYGFAVRPSREY